MSLDTPTSTPISGQPGTGHPAPSQRRHGRTAAAVAAGVVAAGLIAGGGWAVAHLGSDTSAAQSGTDGRNGTGPGGFPGGQGGMGRPPVAGTVSALTGSTITVTPSGGTATTYTVASGTQVLNNGATAELSDLAVGDPVVVIAAAAGTGGTATADRILAGSSATAMPGPGGGRPGSAPQPSTDT
jgi:hypothetical protein